MKRYIALFTLILMTSAMVSCSGNNTEGTSGAAKNIEITEKMYVTYINEIYTNTSDYVGDMITIEGMFTSDYYEQNGKTYYYVYRVGPGCCGNDGSMCGFEFTYDGTMPSVNDWIKVTGKLRTYEEDGYVYLTLDAVSVDILSERGKEVVNS